MEQTTDKREQIMGSYAIPSAILRLAIPAIISMVVMALYNMADTFFIGLSDQGDIGVAAISVFLPIMLITQSLSVLFAAGGAAYLSRLIGAKKLDTAKKAATTTVVLSFIAGLAVAFIGLLFGRPILLMSGASEATIGPAMDYAIVMFLASPLQLTNMSFNNLLRAEGSAVKSMIGLITGALLNIALDPLFIFTFDMGVLGAAVATAISQAVSFVILGSNFLFKKTIVPLQFKQFRFDKDVLGWIFKIGFATFFIQLLTAIGFALINSYAKAYGDDTIAAIGIVNRLQFLGFAVIFGFSQGFQPVAGYNFGAHKYTRLKSAVRFGILMAFLLGSAVTLLYNLCSASLIGLFTKSETVLLVGREALHWFTLGFPLTAFSIILLMLYQSLGRALGSLLLSAFRQGICLLPLVVIFASTMGLQGLLIAPLTADILSGIFAVFMTVSIFKFINHKETMHLAQKI